MLFLAAGKRTTLPVWARVGGSELNGQCPFKTISFLWMSSLTLIYFTRCTVFITNWHCIDFINISIFSLMFMFIQHLIILFESGTTLISLILEALTCSPRLSMGHHSMAQTLRNAAKVESHVPLSKPPPPRLPRKKRIFLMGLRSEGL